ncbi:hypothetical protein RYX36_007357, partial [Vicia faba]
MSKFSSNSSKSNTQNCGSFGYVLTRNKRRECWCQEECVIRTVTDLNSVNIEKKKFWGCRNYVNHEEKGCNFFRWLSDEVVDGRELKIDRQRKKILKLKYE